MEADNAVYYAKEKNSGKSRKDIILGMMTHYKNPNFNKGNLSSRDVEDTIDSHVEQINWVFLKENISLKNDDLWLKRFDQCMVKMRRLQNEIEKRK